MNRFIDNIMQLYKSSDDDTVAIGMKWYAEANAKAKELRDAYFLPTTSHAAGVISVLSPAVKWERNIIDAIAVCSARIGEDVTVSTYGPQKAKAFAIRDGDSPNKWINSKTAPKTYAFWKCIVNPRNSKYVVIDRHALAACHGQALSDKDRGRELSRVGRYGFYSECYREAAKQVGILPLQFQAVVWAKWRQDHA